MTLGTFRRSTVWLSDLHKNITLNSENTEPYFILFVIAVRDDYSGAINACVLLFEQPLQLNYLWIRNNYHCVAKASQ